MSNDDIAAAVLECVGGYPNVSSNSLCATRLRISLRDVAAVDRNALHSIKGVLGVADRGAHGIEVVFGPNLVRGVYRSFERLTGLFARERDTTPAEPERPNSNFQVRITPETPGRPEVTGSVARPTVAPAPIVDDDTNSLLEMLDDSVTGDPEIDAAMEALAEAESDDLADSTPDGARLLVINGPNLNMLGIREPDLYGKADFSALLELCHTSAEEAGFVDCDCYQSNHEGDLVDRIQDAYGVIDGIVINPGAYTHTSVALLDALNAVQIPAIEVHISDVSTREDFRQVSYVRQACLETIMGLGIEGYRKAIFDLADHLGIR